MAIEDFYDTTATVQQMNTNTNTMGGVTKTYTTRISALLCRISVGTIRETDQYGKMIVRTTPMLYCDASSTNKNIAESDRVIVGSNTYEVLTIGNPGLQDHHLEITIEEVR